MLSTQMLLFFSYFSPRKSDLKVHTNYLVWRYFCMKRQILGKIKISISKCRLLKLLPSMLSVKCVKSMHTHNQ